MRRRSLLTVGVFSSLALLVAGGALVACEDGPNQTFSPAPSGAENFWNNGNPDASVSNFGATYDASFGAITPLQLCTADQQRVRWANMLTQPILPGDYNNGLRPTFAGLNLAQPDWAGMTYEQAENVLCSGIDQGATNDGDFPVELATFGENQEVEFFYIPSTHIVDLFQLNLGYTGAADFWSDPAQFPSQHDYHMVIGQEVLKDNVPFPIDWNDPKLATLMEIYYGQMYTYGGGVGSPNDPDTPGCKTKAEAIQGKCPYRSGNVWLGPSNSSNPKQYTYRKGYTCSSDSACLYLPPSIAGTNGMQCDFGIRSILTYWEFDCSVPLQPNVSTVVNMYFFFGKVMPTSHLEQVLQINPMGPQTHGGGTSCDQYLGLEFNTFLQNCLAPADPKITSRSGLLWEKLTGGATHDVENVFFNLIGINMSWTDESLEIPGPADDHLVVTDSYLPVKGDLATDWEFDVRTDSLADNDNPTLQNAPTAYQYRGSGLVQREWGRLLQADMNAKLAAQAIAQGNPGRAALFTHQLGDPACRVAPAQANLAGCTGMEGLAIGGMPEATDNGDGCVTATYSGGSCAATPCFGNICDNIMNAGMFAENYGYGGYYNSTLVPGDPTSYICQDPAQAFSATGQCVDGPVWTNALQAVTSVAGLGNAKLLPFDLQDRRYYFKWWGIAMIKYYKAYGYNPAPYPASLPGNACAVPGKDAKQYLTAQCVANQPIDLTSTFFDNNFGAGFDKDEYIDRSVISPMPINGTSPSGQPITVPAVNDVGGTGPAAVAMDFTYGSDTIAANQRYSNWYRRMDREEAGMFKAMLVDKSNLASGENWVNITNLAGSPLLSANYASYECATQWPTVTVVGNGTPSSPMIPPTMNNWGIVCATTCPAAPLLYPNNCPFPPGVGPSGNFAAPLEMDQNASLAGCSDPSLPTPGCKGYNNSTVTAQPRLFAYPAIWGGTGAACPGSGPKGDPTLENNSYADNTMTDCQSGACANPYQGGCTFGTVANLQGSVFKVGSSDSNNARIGYVPYAGHPDGTDSELLLAYVNLPNMRNPFNSNMDTKIVSGGNPLGSGYVPPAAGSPGSVVVSVPWTPNIDGVGFNIPTSGTTNKFVQTAQLDFTGVLETYLLDVVPWTDPTTGAPTPDHTLKIEAIEGDDFLGEVFLCQDTGTSGGTAGDVLGTQDLLGLHMYDSGLAVLDWLSKHPGLQDSCNIIIQYSQYDNYLDYITSISAGVTVGISQGSGYGRITSVQIFDPSIAAIP